jgi:hypothetical protein
MNRTHFHLSRWRTADAQYDCFRQSLFGNLIWVHAPAHSRWFIWKQAEIDINKRQFDWDHW